MIKRFIAVLLIVVLAFSVMETAAGIGVRTVQYMAERNFTIGNAFQWALNDFGYMLQKVIGATENDDGTREIGLVVEDVKYLLKH